MRKYIGITMILVILLAHSLSFLTLSSKAETVAVQRETLVDNAHVSVQASYEVQGDVIAWTINYEKKSSASESLRRIKLKFNDTAGFLSPTQTGTPAVLQQQEDHWYVEQTFSDTSSGSVTLTTSSEHTKLAVWVELDEKQQNTENAEVKENILQITAPYEIEATSELLGGIPSTTASTEQTTNAITEKTSDTSASSTAETANPKAEKQISNAAVFAESADVVSTAASAVSIIKNEKSAKLLDWNARTYQVNLQVEAQGEIPTASADVILVLDRSLSMQGAPLETLKTTARGFITTLAQQAPNSRVALVSYSASAAQINNFLTVGSQTSGNYTTLINNITGLTAETYTRSDLGMEYAYNLARAKTTTTPLYIIFLSDGVPTQNTVDFNNQVAARAQSWSSLIKNNAMTVGQTKYGAYNVAYSNNAFSTSSNYSIPVTANRPLLNYSSSVYAIQQSSSWPAGSQTFMNGLASSTDKVFLASNATLLNQIFQGLAQEISVAGIIDVVDARFELTAAQKALFDTQGVTYAVQTDGTTKISWPTKSVNGVTSFSNSFEIKAKDGYVGENAVPTNVPAQSGIFVNGERLTGFALANSSLTTPYVNVKLKPLTGSDQQETIYLGEAARTETAVKEGLLATVVPSSYTAGLGAYPAITVNGLTGYTSRPSNDVVYTTTAVAAAAKATADAAALTYADGPGRGTSTLGVSADNKAVVTLKHSVFVKTVTAAIAKTLQGNKLPADYKPAFTIAKADQQTLGTPQSTFANGSLSLSQLGIGTYTISETVPQGVRNDGPWTLTIAKNSNQEIVKKLTTKDGVVLANLTIDNKWKSYELLINKVDTYGKAVAGASFQLTKDGQVYAPQTAGSLADNQTAFVNLTPGSYQLTETKAPRNFEGLTKSLEVRIGEDGAVYIDEQQLPVSYQSEKNVITYEVVNQAKGVLPMTGSSMRSWLMLIAWSFIAAGSIATLYYWRHKRGEELS